MSEINENELSDKELEQASGGRTSYTYNCPDFALKKIFPEGLEMFVSKECANCVHFTGDNKTLCDLKI